MTTTDEITEEEIAEWWDDIIEDLFSMGFVPPFWIMAISLNGWILNVRYDPDDSGLSVTTLWEHKPEPKAQLPMNVLCTDSRGEAVRVVLSLGGTRWIEVD